MAAHRHFGADTVVCRGASARQRGFERHTADRRAPGAARDLHGHTAARAARLETDLARADGSWRRSAGVSPIVLEYTADRQISINQQPVVLERVAGAAYDVYESRHDKTMFIAGAGSLRYGEIVQVIDAAKGAGVQRVGIVTDGMRRDAR